MAFVAETDWPFKLDVAGQVYTLFCCGFWNGDHYWSKLLKNSNGAVGIWLQDDQANQGNAKLIDHRPDSIAGKMPHMSFVIYSRKWTANEDKTVEEAIAKIRKKNPTCKGVVPFSNLRMLLDISPDSNAATYKDHEGREAPSRIDGERSNEKTAGKPLDS